MPRRSVPPQDLIGQRNRRLTAVTVALLLLLAGYFGYWWHIDRNWVDTDDAFVTGHLVTVKAQTEGAVAEILAENTQLVKQGQALVRLDGVRAKIDLQHAEAALGETVRQIASLRISAQTFGYKIAAKQAELDRVAHDLRRLKGAEPEGGASAQQIQNASDKIRELAAAIKALQSEKAGIEAQVGGVGIEGHPSVEKAKNALRQAYLAYQRRNILVPASGFVAKRRVQIGDTVKEGTPLLVIVPLDDLWIEANFLESQAGKIRPGQRVEIRTDLYGDEIIYHGRVQGIQPGTGSSFALFPTDNSTGNFIHVAERVPVRIGLDPKELARHPLRPGLSTLTRINVADAGKNLLSSTVTTQTDVYRTRIFENEINEAERLIENIIRQNSAPENSR